MVAFSSGVRLNEAVACPFGASAPMKTADGVVVKPEPCGVTVTPSSGVERGLPMERTIWSAVPAVIASGFWTNETTGGVLSTRTGMGTRSPRPSGTASAKTG